MVENDIMENTGGTQMHIEEASLRNYVYQTWLYFQANDTFYTGALQDISISKIKNNGQEEYIVNAMFEGRRKDVHIKFNVDNRGCVRKPMCSCHYKEKDIGCIHLIATVNAINEIQPTQFPFHINYQAYLEEQERLRELELARIRMEQSNIDLFRLLDTMQKERIASLIADDEKKIHIHIDLDNPRSYQGFFEIGFTMGTDKLYRMKDIRKTVAGFANEVNYPLGKSASIQLKRSSLDEYSQWILDFLNSHAYETDWKRTAWISADMLDDLYNLLSKLPTDYYDFYIQNHDFKFPFQIKKKENSYLLELNPKKIKSTNRLYLGKKHLYAMDNRVFHRYKLDDYGQVGMLVNHVHEEESIFIKDSNMKEFYLRMIHPNLNYLDIECDFDLSMFETTISDIQIFSDLEDSQLRIWGKYWQDGQEKKLFTDGKAQEILSIEAIIKNYANSIKDEIAIFKTRGSRLNGFLDQGIPLLMEQAKVYVTDELIRLKERKAMNLSIGVRVKNNLLEMNIDTRDVSRDELIHILNAYRRKKKFYQLKNGQTIDLEQESIQKLDALTEELNVSTKDLKKDTITKPAYQVMHVDDVEFKIHSDQSIDEYTNKLDTIRSTTLNIPDKYKQILRGYQIDGIQWLDHLNKMELNGILADDMGLGKTLQVLIYLENFVKSEDPILVVCPSSLMYNWDGEIKKFEIDIDYVCVTGSMEERKNRIQQKHAMYITTYDYLKRDIAYYEKTTFEYIILDEAQYIKNPKTQNAQCVKQLTSKHRLALTGTPIENSLSELWSIFDFLLPGYLYGLAYFVKNFEKPIRLENDEKKQSQLKRLVEPFILRRTKEKVLTDLPDKIEKEMWLDFNESEKNLYVANLSKINAQLQEQLKLEHMDSILILAMMTRLRQICCEARMLYDTIKAPSTKLEMCIDLIKTLKDNKKKVLLFSSFTTVFDMLEEEFKKQGITYHILTGQTNKEKRKEEVDAFQNDDSDVFLISLKAGGTGLNLTSAQAVIHFDPWWNVSAQNQATDRAYRIGQTKNVLVYQLLMKNTIEEKIFEMQKNKKQMSDFFIENSKGGISSLSKEELKDIFSIK